jgi:uncharacterized OsmC-like protein
MTAPQPVREYEIRARTTDVFGRVLCSARDHHFIVDGPVQNGCPGEEVTPAEVFLSGVAACGVELVEVIARDEGVPITRIRLTINGTVDRSNQPRPDITIFNSVRLRFTIGGTDAARATTLVEGFKRRCPLYGTVATAIADVKVEVSVEP